MDITKGPLVLAAAMFAASASLAQTQTQSDTTCTTMPDGSRINCTSRSTSSDPSASAGGAAKGVVDALNKNRERKSVDWDALEKSRNAKVELHFAQAKSNIEDIRANFAKHQQSGEPFPKETLKAFNHYRKEACKWGKWLRNPVPMDSLISDLDGTPRTCAESNQFK